MARKRGSGEGSIYKRDDGVWVASVTLGRDDAGRRRRRVVYAGSQAEAVEKLGALRTERMDGTLTEPSKLRLGEYLDRWLHDSARTRVRPTTLGIYESLIRVHIKPHLGGVALSKLAPAHVQGLLGSLERGGVSPRLRQMVRSVLSVALKQAVRLEIMRRNPVAAVDRPRAPKPEIRSLEVDECRKLLEAAKGDRLEALYVVAVATGLRQGEIFGLRWGDVDLGERALQVRRTLTEENRTGQMVFAEPKTAKSRRRVDLPSFAVAALTAHRAALGAAPHPDRLVFTDTDGKPLRKSNVQRRSFKPLLARAGLPQTTRFHDLRHSAATLLLAQGVHPKIVQERLGHSTIALTLDTYSHVLKGLGAEAASKLDAILGA
ncbi:MAG: site-specific integrase [Deltaproteobacteria bacterium]|nr:site-specific integrase [Deltaproteobacteria bacterium]